MSKNLNFSSLDFNDIEQSKISRELIDHLFMLKEQLEYTLSNLGTDNWNQKELEIFAEKISVKGAVTFEDLKNGDETIINGAYIKSGVVEASTFRAFLKEINGGCSVNGEVSMFYVPEKMTWEEAVKKDDETLAGGLKLDNRGDDNDEENTAQYCMWVYTRNCFDGDDKVALKLSSEYRASLEAVEGIFIYTSEGYITIRGPEIHLEGDVFVNGEQIS